jgi:aryl-alcohol dehydrogenase-like predicted oxidoreductase
MPPVRQARRAQPEPGREQARALGLNILLIPGTRTRAHLAENLAAADVRLDAAARADVTRRFPLTR